MTTMGELNALAETLRASIASLDEQTERRARVIAAELAAAGEPLLSGTRGEQIGQLLQESMDRLQLAGRLMRDELAEQVPEAAQALQRFPDEVWTASALLWAVDFHPAGARIAAELRVARSPRPEVEHA